MQRQGLQWAALALLDACALATAGPAALATARHPAHARTLGIDALTARLSTTVLAVVAIWLAAGLACAALALLPGSLGRAAAGLHRAVVPAAVRRLIAGGAGLGVLLAPAAAAASSRVPIPPGSTSSSTTPVPAPTWPTSGTPNTPPSTPTVPPATPAPAPPTPPVRPSSAGPVTVRPGDSLWLLAARRLGPSATDAQVAGYWPRIWRANRAVVGADPDLIHPGQSLRLPDPTSKDVTR